MRACSVVREVFVCWYFVCVRACGPLFADISAGTRANVAVIAATEFQEDFLLDADVASPKHAPYKKKLEWVFRTRQPALSRKSCFQVGFPTNPKSWHKSAASSLKKRNRSHHMVRALLFFKGWHKETIQVPVHSTQKG